MEMNALAQCCNFNVIVHQVDRPSMVHTFHEPIGSRPTIHISFHLDGHYNSVRRADDPMEKGCVPIFGYPIGHELEKLKDIVDDNIEEPQEEKSLIAAKEPH